MGKTKVVQKRFVAARMDRMGRTKLQWLWPQRIALGTLTVLAGDFESGKSLLSADLAARVSRGGAVLVGRTAEGRTTIFVLGINRPLIIARRVALIAEGLFPPS